MSETTHVTHVDDDGDEARAGVPVDDKRLVLLRTSTAGVHFTREQWGAFTASVVALFRPPVGPDAAEWRAPVGDEGVEAETPGEYVSIPVPPSPELIEKALGEWNQHEMTTHSRAGRPGFVVNECACSCGAPLPWRDFEAHFDAHRLGAVLRALGEAP